MVVPPGNRVDPPAAPPRGEKSWVARNWGWLVPIGCLGIVMAFGVFVLGLLGVVAVSMRSSDVYREALARASIDSTVVAELGSPVKPGFFVSGSVQVSGPSGHADMSIPISGPKNEGTVYAVATKSAGTWTFTRLEVEVKGRPSRIPLLTPSASP